MPYHIDLGKQAEDAAVDFLVKKNYTILERNWRWRKAEVDIIAMENETLIFVEVKGRHTLRHGDPLQAISKTKMNWYLKGAGHYMSQINHEWAIRFDAISVIIQNEQVMQIDHYESTFSPWD